MSDQPRSFDHLSDDDIDAYWKGQISSQDEERLEQHFLECADCRVRVQAVVELAGQLGAADGFRHDRRVTYWRLAAAVLAAISLFAIWQWARVSSQQAPVMATTAPAAAPLIAVTLAPPTRAGGTQEVTLRRGSVVLFALDAREAGAPGTAFEVRLIAPDQRSVLQLARSSTSEGIVSVPVDSTLLPAGSYVFELRAGAEVVGVPFLIRY